MHKNRVVFCLLVIFILGGCRGWRSEKPPIHVNPNMDFQASYKAQEQPMDIPENTVPWGFDRSFSDSSSRKDIIKKDSVYYYGKNRAGSWVSKIPLEVNYEFLNRGRERFNIFCSSCHGKDGSGNGPVVQGRWIKPVPYWHERVMAYPDGQLYNIVSEGIRSMPGYKQQLKESDRWAIVAYLRALQKSNTATLSDVPLDKRSQLK
ncbi:quinol:cytochrome C oxidoreductase [Candidatus Marinamargulisbacteria bacterium SCGC AG-343-D04]|nr:quinol:cytochrome C oxidoreductase [Candidatus Marinamargulisbacteria bacterium SCGC AG-343-D04]